ncbi:unnamed protein product [Prunus armeniaca]|uniref:Uncharacterized protein n=1 Tax=Prunus armeniaca TaxID=36596 RepID=A0A6J5UJB0_PRUAR|nr:unnamed protein product [Prunus armeniaca]
MKSEGRQHGMFRPYRVLPDPLNLRPGTRQVNKFDSLSTAGLFTKVATKPTNHSKFTGKCGKPRCTECHIHPASKAKDKTKGNHKLKSSDVISNHRLVKFSGSSATGILDHLSTSHYDNNDDDDEEDDEISGYANGNYEDMGFFNVEYVIDPIEEDEVLPVALCLIDHNIRNIWFVEIPPEHPRALHPQSSRIFPRFPSSSSPFHSLRWMGCSEPDISHPQEESDYNELPTSLRLDIDVQRDCRSSKDSSAEKSQAVIDHEHDSPRECQSPKGSSFEKRQVVIDTEQECQSPVPSSIDKNQVEIDCEECETPKFYSVSMFEMDVDGGQDLQSPNVPCADVPGAGMAMKGEEYIYVVPQVGVEFESEDHLYNCYSRYAVLEALLLSHLQRHSLLQLCRSKAVLGYGLGQIIPVAANDVAFSIHAVLLTAITLYQIAIYERGNQKVSKISIGIVAAMWLGAAVCVFLALPSHSWIWLISIFK